MKQLYYKGYDGTIEVSLDENELYGLIINYKGKPIKDVVLYEGETPKKLYKCFKESVNEYIEIRKELDK